MNFPADEVLIDHLVSLQVVCERAVRVSAGHTLETLAANELLQLALAMAVAQIGEVNRPLSQNHNNHQQLNAYSTHRPHAPFRW